MVQLAVTYEVCIGYEMKKSQKKRVGRPTRSPLDKFRTVLWFWAIANKIGVPSAYAVEKYYFEKTNEQDKKFASSGKFNKYQSGKHTPSESLVSWFEKRFKGTQKWLNHPVWSIATPTNDIETLYKKLISLRPEIRKMLFYTNEETKRVIPIRRGMRCSDELGELDIESDFDSFAAVLGIIQETQILDRKPKVSLHRLIAVRILTRMVSSLPSLAIMPEFFSYLRRYFLDDPKDRKWNKKLECISFPDHNYWNKLTLDIVKGLNILKYFKDPPMRCLYYGQLHLSPENIFKFHNHFYEEDGIKKLKRHPEISQLTTKIKQWERSLINNNSLTEYSGLRSTPVNTSTLVS